MDKPYDAFQRYLDPGERIVWAGGPRQGVIFSGRDIFLVPFSLMWGGFAIFWESTVVLTGGPVFFALWGVPFVVVGLYLIFGRFIADAWVRSRTVYALTDQRALILRQTTGERLTAVMLRNAVQTQLTLHGARGDIDFEAGGAWNGLRRPSAAWSLWMPSLGGASFIGIDEPENVYRLAEQGRRTGR